jgi:signal transduction histidine kinase
MTFVRLRYPSLRARIVLLFSFSLVVGLASTGLLVARLFAVSRAYDQIVRDHVDATSQVRLLQVDFKKQVQEWKDVLLRGFDAQDRRRYTDLFNRQRILVAQRVRAISASMTDRDTQAMLGEFTAESYRLNAAYERALAVFVEADGQNPRVADRMVRGMDRPPTDLIDRLAEHINVQFALRSRVERERLARDSYAVAMAGLLLGAIGVVAVTWISISFTRPLAELTEAADRVAHGDVAVQLVASSKRDELGLLARSFQSAIRSLNLLVAETDSLITAVKEGRLNARGRADQFQGVYAELVLGINGIMHAMESLHAELALQRDDAQADLRNTSAQLLQAQKMEAIGRLAGGVAHDFNNLLTVILGFADIVVGDESVDAGVRSNVEEIRAAAVRASNLTRQLLTFSRKQVSQPRVLSLNRVIDEAASMLKRMIGEDVVLAWSLEPGLSPVRVDPGQVSQVLMNLSVNARDAMPAGGRLVIATSNTRFRPADGGWKAAASEQPFVALTVTDTGCGMPPEVLAHAFEPFFTTKEHGKGTGLGLSTVYGIVEQHGGHVEIDSRVGAGTTVRIYWPAATSDAERTGAGTGPADDGASGSETILVVEDQDMVRHMISATLRRKGYHVLEASSGVRALELARAYPGDLHLLMTDVVMPGLSGPEVAERIGHVRPGIRVIYMSGHDADGLVQRGGFKDGAEFIEKRFTTVPLARTVRRVLDATVASGGAGA